RRAVRRPLQSATSLVRVPLFLPWITIDVITEVLPKTRSVVRHQRHALHPFGALPQIKMGNEEPRRAAVFGRKIGAIKFEREPGLLVHNIFQREVRRVIAIRTEHCVGEILFYVSQQGVEQNTFPRSAEFRPSCYTVNVNSDMFGGQLAKRLPIPALHDVAAVVNRKFPAIKGYVWCRSRRQHGEVRSEVLTRRKFGFSCAASAGKTLRDDSHRISYSASDLLRCLILNC